MSELHNIIADLRQTMVYMAYGLIKDYNEIQEIVQETLVYMLQMNQTTLQKIYDKDGKDGLLRYAGVVMRRSVHSTKSINPRLYTLTFRIRNRRINQAKT